MVTPKGKTNPGDTQKSALLIIDVQQGLFEKSTTIYRADELLSSINGLVEKAHSAGVPVVYIQHCGKKHLLKDTESWKLHQELNPEPEDWLVLKENSSGFEATDLAGRLASHGIGRVVAAGLVTHGCVKNTCLGGLKEGFQVTLAADAHSNFSKNAPKLIDKWNEQLAEMGVTVTDSLNIHFD